MLPQSEQLYQVSPQQDIPSNDLEEEETKVIIVGCGPTGALLSALLGRLSVPNVVLEKEHDIASDPQGIALYEDGIRLLQELGLYDKVYSDMGQCIGYVYFTSGKYGLNTKPFLKLNFNTTEGGTGHIGGIRHRQPTMEKYLRSVAQACPSSLLKLGSTVVGIEEDDASVRVTCIADDGRERRIRSAFLVGADGKVGFTRKKYLEPREYPWIRSVGE